MFAVKSAVRVDLNVLRAARLERDPGRPETAADARADTVADSAGNAM